MLKGVKGVDIGSKLWNQATLLFHMSQLGLTLR
jgi:hypothetical protein